VFHIAQARLAAPTIEQRAAAHMLRSISSDYVVRAHAEYLRRRNAAVDALAAFTCWPNFRLTMPRISRPLCLPTSRSRAQPRLWLQRLASICTVSRDAVRFELRSYSRSRILEQLSEFWQRGCRNTPVARSRTNGRN
jgi:aspartate/methionine/tyrosine aminotransferase